MTTHFRIFQNSENAVAYAAGQTIFSEGDAAEVMYAVQEGEVEIVAGDTVLNTLGADEIFGEMALVDKSPRSAAARTLSGWPGRASRR